MRFRPILAAPAAALAALSLTACGADGTAEASGEKITLRYAFFAPAASFPSVQMEKWAEELAARTDGQVEVELFVGGTLLSSGDIFDGVSEGTIDVGMDSPAYDTERFPLSSVINVPVGIESSEVASRTFLSLLEEYEPEEFADFEIVTAFTTEPAYVQTSDPVTASADISGLTLRTAGAGIPILEKLGASPVGMSMADVAEALNTGVISGYLSSREVLQDFGLAENIGYVTDYPFGVSNSFVAVMDRERFDALPADVQEEIRGLREEMMLFASQFHDAENVQAALDWAEQEHGTQIVSLDETTTAEWDQVAQDRAAEWVEQNSGSGFDAEQVLDRMRELAEEYAAGS